MVIESRTNNTTKDKGVALKLKKTSKRGILYSFAAKYTSIFFFASVFLTGILIGALAAGHIGSSLLEELDFLLHTSFMLRAEEAYSTVFVGSFASSFLFVFFLFLLGLSVWGFVCIPFVLLFRGFGAGITAGYLYCIYSWKGFFYHFLTILPGGCICAIALLLAAREASRTSRSIGLQKPPNYILFLNRFGAVLCMTFCASIMDTICTSCFARFFSF